MAEQALGHAGRSRFPGVTFGEVPLSRRALPGGAAEHVSQPGRQFHGPTDGQPDPVEVGGRPSSSASSTLPRAVLMTRISSSVRWLV